MFDISLFDSLAVAFSNHMHICTFCHIIFDSRSICVDISRRYFSFYFWNVFWNANTQTRTHRPDRNSCATLKNTYIFIHTILYSFFLFAFKLLRRHSQFFFFFLLLCSHYRLFVYIIVATAIAIAIVIVYILIPILNFFSVCFSLSRSLARYFDSINHSISKLYTLIFEILLTRNWAARMKLNSSQRTRNKI